MSPNRTCHSGKAKIEKLMVAVFVGGELMRRICGVVHVRERIL